MCFVLAKDFAHHVADLTESCISLDGSQDMRHQVLILVLASLLQVSKSILDGFVITLAS